MDVAQAQAPPVASAGGADSVGVSDASGGGADTAGVSEALAGGGDCVRDSAPAAAPAVAPAVAAAPAPAAAPAAAAGSTLTEPEWLKKAAAQFLPPKKAAGAKPVKEPVGLPLGAEDRDVTSSDDDL